MLIGGLVNLILLCTIRLIRSRRFSSWKLVSCGTFSVFSCSSFLKPFLFMSFWLY